MSIDVRVSSEGAPAILLSGHVWDLLCQLDEQLNQMEAADVTTEHGNHIHSIKQGSRGRRIGGSPSARTQEARG